MIIRSVHWLAGGLYRPFGLQSRTSVFAGHPVHYYESNGGPGSHTVMFVHGLGTSSSTWIYTLPRLKIRDRVLAVDLPGFGRSPLPPGDAAVPFRSQMEVLSAILGNAGPTSYSLVGHSLGGWLAMLLALAHPHQLRHLVLLNPAGIWYEGYDELASALEVQSMEDTRRLLDRVWFRFPWYYRPFIRAIHGELQARRVVSLIRSIRQEDFINDQLHRLPESTLIVWGENDRLISLRSLSVFRRALPSARVVIIGRCGHVPQLESPRKTIEALRMGLDLEGNS